jgi:hypothetical protein
LPAKIIVGKFFIDPWARITDGGKIPLIQENAWMHGPLATSPRAARMDHAPVTIKDAVTGNYFHLDNVAGDSQIFFGNLCHGQPQITNHPCKILFIKGDRGLSVTTMATSFTFKNFFFQPAAPVKTIVTANYPYLVKPGGSGGYNKFPG